MTSKLKLLNNQLNITDKSEMLKHEHNAKNEEYESRNSFFTIRGGVIDARYCAACIQVSWWHPTTADVGRHSTSKFETA